MALTKFFLFLLLAALFFSPPVWGQNNKPLTIEHFNLLQEGINLLQKDMDKQFNILREDINILREDMNQRFLLITVFLSVLVSVVGVIHYRATKRDESSAIGSDNAEQMLSLLREISHNTRVMGAPIITYGTKAKET